MNKMIDAILKAKYTLDVQTEPMREKYILVHLEIAQREGKALSPISFDKWKQRGFPYLMTREEAEKIRIAEIDAFSTAMIDAGVPDMLRKMVIL